MSASQISDVKYYLQQCFQIKKKTTSLTEKRTKGTVTRPHPYSTTNDQ